MTPEQKRIACAKEIGYRAWKREKIYSHGMEYEWSRGHPDNQRINGFELTEHESLCDPKSLPQFLTDANAALELVAHLAKQGWTCAAYMRKDGSWKVIFSKFEDDFFACGGTLPLAIVDAFLSVTKGGKE